MLVRFRRTQPGADSEMYRFLKWKSQCHLADGEAGITMKGANADYAWPRDTSIWRAMKWSCLDGLFILLGWLLACSRSTSASVGPLQPLLHEDLDELLTAYTLISVYLYALQRNAAGLAVHHP